MHDKHKTETQLITELEELRLRVAQLEEAGKTQRNHAPFRSLVETAASAIFIFQDSVFRYTNPAASKLSGYTAEELLGANIWNLVHPEHRELIKERVEAWQRGEPVPRRSEFKILTKSGETRWIDADSTFIEFEGNLASLTIAYDSTDHKRAEEALNESEQRYRKIIETAQEAIWVVDAEANSTYVNQHLAEMLGYTREELLGRSVFDFVDDADRVETRRYLERGKSGIKEQHDFRFRRRDGSELWTMVSTTPLFDSGGSFVGGLAMLIDITERRRSEEALRKSEERWRTYIEQASDLIFILDKSGRMISVNKAACETTGYASEEMLGKTPLEFVAPEQRAGAAGAMRNRLAGLPLAPIDLDILSKDGRRVSLEVRGRTLYDGTELSGAFEIARDITDRKRAEEALRDSEAKFRVLAETAASMIFIYQDSRCVYVNPYSTAYTGYTDEELLSIDFMEIVHPEHRELVRERAGALLRGEAVPSHYEVKIVTKGGEARWIDFAASPLEFQGKPSVLGTAFDITERKRVEEALRESENRFRTLAETASDAMITIDESGRIAFVNQAAEKVFGYSQHEMLSAELTMLMPEYLRHLHRKGFARYRETGKRHLSWETIELPGLHKNGKEIPLELSIGEFTQGDRRFFTGIARDITDRKRAEEALRKTRERLQHVLSFSPAIIYLLQLEGESFTIEWVSDSLTRLTGYEPGEALSEGWWVRHIHPEDRRRVLTELPRLLTGDRLALEFRFQHKDGGYLWVHNESRLLRDQSGKPVEVVGSWADVTERREAEVALRDSEERFRTLVSSMDDIVFTVDREQRYSGVFGRWLEKFGRDRGIIIGKTASEILGAEAGRLHVEANERALTGEQVVYEWSMATNQETRHFHASLSPIRDQSGEVTGLVGVGRDITDRKQAGEALRASEERYRDLVENARDIIYSHDMKGNYTSVNKAVEQITGYTREEALKMNLAQTVAPEYLEKARRMIANKLAGQEETVYDLEIIAKDGRRITVEVNTRLVFQNNVPVGILGIARDVTERKRAEEALRESQERFRRYFELGLIGMAITEAERINGYRAEEIIGQHFSRFYAAQDIEQDRPQHDLQAAITEGSCKYEGWRLRQDGTQFWADDVLEALRDEQGRLTGFLEVTRDITQRREREEALRQSEQLLCAIMDNSPALIYITDIQGRYILVNHQFETMSHLTKAEIIGKTAYDLYPTERADVYRAREQQVIESCKPVEVAETAAVEDELHHYISMTFPLNDSANRPYAICGISTDITAHKSLEDQLRHSHKMEAIGMLAGGIAHDFNNLLTAIIGYSQLLMRGFDKTDPRWAQIEEIEKAGMRASALTSQLLAFSRKQILRPQILDLNWLMDNVSKLLRRVIGEDIELVTILDPQLAAVEVDPGLIDQVIMNLAVNARDAMPQGGKLTIETASVDLNSEYYGMYMGVPNGNYAMLTVSDTGCGMEKETQTRIFDPFFTTKDQGKGTGLGLSTVYGIVKQSGGHIRVYSEPGRGSTFKIFLPRTEGVAEAAKAMHADTWRRSSDPSATILLVEDEGAVRTLARIVLEMNGYTVLAAAGAKEALQQVQSYTQRIHLLVTDVVMPGMDGKALVNAIGLTRGDIKVLYMSGYTDEAIVKHGILEPGIAFLQKPFSPEGLVRKVREVLEGISSTRQTTARPFEPIAVQLGRANKDTISRKTMAG